jgi:hypothetical protein
VNAGNQQQVAQQAELLGEGGKDEVGGALGNEFQVGLRALHEALAPDPARADGDHALDDVKTLAQRVSRRVQQGADALLLVVAQHRPAHAIGAQAAVRSTTSRMTPAAPAPPAAHTRRQLRPAKKITDRPAASTSSEVPRSGCFMMSADRHHQQQAGHGEVQRPQLAFAFLEPPGQHQRHRDLEDFAGLDDGDAHDCSQRVAPLRVMPNSATAISSATPSMYSGTATPSAAAAAPAPPGT